MMPRNIGQSILLDTQPPVTGEEGREVVKVMEMIVKKLKEKYGSREPA